MTREEKKEELIGLFSIGAIYLGDLIDECFEFGQHHPHWISGEDKPRENGFYLCYSDKEKAYEILSLYGADWYDAYGHYIPSCDVTHWMPLPAPPEHIADVSKKISSSELPNNCEKGGEQ